jgi:hypothetical protein
MFRNALLAISISLSATATSMAAGASLSDKNRWPNEERRTADAPVILYENESALETPAMSRRFLMEPRIDKRGNSPRDHGAPKLQ